MEAILTRAILTSIIGIIGVIIGAVLTAWLGPWVSEKFKLREIYLAPFRKWCSKLYGELDEFNRRYLSKDTDCLDHSSIQIIDDYRMIHEVFKDAPIWVGKVEKERKDSLVGKIKSKMHKDRKDIDDHLKKLIDIVDRFWHELEGQYSLQLKDRMDIIQICDIKRKEIAEKICKHIEHIKKTSYLNIESILNYLRKKKIP